MLSLFILINLSQTANQILIFFFVYNDNILIAIKKLFSTTTFLSLYKKNNLTTLTTTFCSGCCAYGPKQSSPHPPASISPSIESVQIAPAAKYSIKLAFSSKSV